MDRTVVALFDDVNNAQRAVEELLDNGFDRNDISVLRTDQGAPNSSSTAAETDTPGTSAMAAGAGVGAVLGGIAGLVVGLGALAIPGIGPLVAAGPLAAALAGAGMGAAAGSVVGALNDAGIPATEAENYAEGIRRGGTLVTVRTSESDYARVAPILNRFSPVDMDQRVTEWRSGHEIAFETKTNPYTNVYRREFDDHENDFREDCQARYGSTGYGYERYRPAYEYGWQARKLFRTRAWEAIEPELQVDWEHTHSGNAWEDFKDAVRIGWQRFKEDPVDPDRGAEQGFERTTSDRTIGLKSPDFDTYEGEFQGDWERAYRTSSGGYNYDEYRPSYQYGYHLATERRYQGRRWDEIEPEARRDWEAQHPGVAWEDYKDAVQHAYERVRVDIQDQAR